MRGYYRGKRKDTGEWVYGDLVHDWSRHHTKPDIVIQNNIGKYKVVPETVGQETGVPDRNGKKIFDGDICRDTKTGEIVSAQWHGTMAGFVWSKRKDNSYLFDFGALFRACDKYEVIGNIHDNPELLERKDGDSE